MFLSGFAILLISGMIGSGFSMPGDFDIYYYFGDVSQSILRLYYTKTNLWPRQPSACYGVLIDWKIAMFPCSCVSYTKDDKQTDKAWRQNAPIRNEMIDVSTLEVGTMMEEYNPRYGNPKVKISKYVQPPIGTDQFACKSDLLFEFVVVELASRIKYSTLIWFPTENITVMRNLTQEGIEQGDSFYCKITLWQRDEVMDNSTNQPKVKFFRESLQVTLTDWNQCNDTVCPTFSELQDYKVNITNNTWKEDIPSSPSGMKQDPDICLNRMKRHLRGCLTWRNGPGPICGLVPGTPVTCEGTRFSGGIIGTITNTTLFCPPTGYTILDTPINLVAEAFPLIHNYLRIKNAPGYDGFFTLPPQGPNQLYVIGKSGERNPANKLQPVSTFAILSFSIVFSVIIDIKP